LTSRQPRCSEEALFRGEPLLATASLVTAWLVVEQPGAWGPDALSESQFPGEIAAELERRASGVRILLIRHRSPSSDGPVIFKAHSGGPDSKPVMVSGHLPVPSGLLDVDFDALANGEPGPGTPVEQPIYLVCTHGRHDICCADKGRPLYRAMSASRPDRTWEVSHLGGDRFAANVLVLPRGDYFGRLEPEDADPFVNDYEAGRLALPNHRGRSIYPRLAQAAEHFVREAEDLVGLDALVLVGYTRLDHDHAEVAFRMPTGLVTALVAAHRGPELDYLTCRSDRPGHPVGYELLSISKE
jgi:hypothetical protein